MIRKTLEIIREELQAFMDLKDPEKVRKAAVVLSNILEQDGKEAYNTGVSDGTSHFMVLTLANIQEERHLRPAHGIREIPGPELLKQNPEVNLNLFLLCSAFSSQYETALDMVADVIKFFQAKPYFDPANTPGMDAEIKKIVADLDTMSFEQQNYLWGLMGAKYMPSVVYKLRTFSLADEGISDKSKPVTEINITDKSK